MGEFEKQVSNFIAKHELIRSNDKLLLAVSGGPDSLALLHYITHYQSIVPRSDIVVAHVNHLLRRKSGSEAAFVRQMAKKNGLRYEEISVSVREKAKQRKQSIEETARVVRYAFFNDLMGKLALNKLLLAHHADDQVETILMRLVRGSSSTGWSGIKPIRPLKNGFAIRPFLTVTKENILNYCRKHHIEFMVDESNESETFTRNRFRKHILPFLKKENEAMYAHFARFSEETLADFQALEELAQEIFIKNARLVNSQIKLPTTVIKTAKEPLQRRIIHLLLNYLYQGSEEHVTTQQIQMILQLAHQNNPSAELHFAKGIVVRRCYDQIEGFSKTSERSVTKFHYRINVNEGVFLPNGAKLKLEVRRTIAQAADRETMVINADQVTLPLVIRNRLPGDKMILKGRGGTKKIKDIFIDEKIPKHQRDSLAIVTDSANKILWIPEVKKSIYDVAENRDHNQYILKYNRFLGGNESMNNDIQEVLISEGALQEKVKELGQQLTAEYKNKNPLVVGILKGATPFMMDLTKHMDIFIEMDFMDVSSYGNNAVSSGEVKIIKDLNTSVEGRDVLLVEDIIDSGRTLNYLVDLMKYRKANSVKLVTLLDKPEGRKINITADYVGFEVPNKFVVGYGLDYAEKYRNLPYIGILKPEIYSE